MVMFIRLIVTLSCLSYLQVFVQTQPCMKGCLNLLIGTNFITSVFSLILNVKVDIFIIINLFILGYINLCNKKGLINEMNEILKLIDRKQFLFNDDIQKHSKFLKKLLINSFLVIGGAGSIGQAVVREILKENQKKSM